METADWALLGIAPTRDLIAIKKAYAALLKVTRPDDDAQAYQGLRDAYDRAQRWAGAPQDALLSPPAALPSMEAVAKPPAPSICPPALIDHTATPDRTQAAELVEQAESLWQAGGNPGLEQGWPQLLAQLQARPDAMRAHDALAFAQWLAASQRLPAPVRRSLQQHFGWQRDYRLIESLGEDLAEAVLAELDDLDDDANVMASRHPLARLEKLWRTPGHRGHAFLIASCGRPRWAHLWAQASGSRRLRLNLRQASALRLLLALATLPRLAMLAVVLVPLSLLLIGGPAAALLPLLILIWPVNLLLRGVLWLGGAALLWDLSLLGGGAGEQDDWRISATRLGLALTALASAATLALLPATGRLGEVAHGLSLMALISSVFIVRWTRLTSRSPAVVACFIAAWPLWHWALSPTNELIGSAALAAAWTLLGTAAYESRLGSSLATVVAKALTWPVSRTLSLADHWGWPFTYWPSASVAFLALGARLTEHTPWLALLLAIVWASWTTALCSAQARLDRHAQAALEPSPRNEY